MDWKDEGFVLSARKHGENSAIVMLLTRDNGRHAGLVRGGGSRRARGVYQAGNLVSARWRARLDEHLGTYSCELLYPYAAQLLGEPLQLLALASAAATLDQLLPERAPHPEAFDAFRAVLEALRAEDGWLEDFVRWELSLLSALGYGLDLSRCAATGVVDGLTYVSPRTGRAVSAAAGEPWRGRLLKLPSFLTQDARGEATLEIADGLALTGHFLARCAKETAARPLPEARARLIDRLRKTSTISGII